MREPYRLTPGVSDRASSRALVWVAPEARRATSIALRLSAGEGDAELAQCGAPYSYTALRPVGGWGVGNAAPLPR
jgi:hypothetical protein